MHILDKDISKLSKAFENEYGYSLVGTGLCQFHSDFDMKGCKNVYSEQLITLGKKCYMDCLVGENKITGEIERSSHVRMKGINLAGIEHYATNNDLSLLQVYEKLYDGNEITFDLLTGGKCCKFQYNKNLSVSSKSEFSRTVSFNYEEDV